jgi:predicted RNase H-like nuclease (RuvC/YqgF family)
MKKYNQNLLDFVGSKFFPDYLKYQDGDQVRDVADQMSIQFLDKLQDLMGLELKRLFDTITDLENRNKELTLQIKELPEVKPAPLPPLEDYLVMLQNHYKELHGLRCKSAEIKYESEINRLNRQLEERDNTINSLENTLRQLKSHLVNMRDSALKWW